MVWGLAFAPEALPQLLAAALMLLLAGWIVWLNFAHRATRVFAVLLLIRATTMILTSLRELSTGPASSYFERVLNYFIISFPLIVVYFVAVYPRPRGWLGRNRLGLAVLVGIGLFLEGLYLFDHSMFETTTLDTAGHVQIVSVGPLFLMVGFFYLLPAVASFLFAIDYVRSPPGFRRPAILLVCLGFTLNAIHDGARVLLGPFPIPVDATATATHLLWGLALVPPLATMGLLGIHALRSTNTRLRSEVLRFLVVCPIPILTVGWIAFEAKAGNEVSTLATLLVAGIWRLALAVLAAYALVRHRLFGIHVRIRWTVKQGTVAAIFVAVFFVVSEGTAVMLSSKWGSTAGILAAGLLLFALTPLQRAAEHFAAAALPQPFPGPGGDEGRAEFYREQVRILAEDHPLTSKEKMLLDHTRKQLGLSSEAAERLEDEVLSRQARTEGLKSRV